MAGGLTLRELERRIVSLEQRHQRAGALTGKILPALEKLHQDAADDAAYLATIKLLVRQLHDLFERPDDETDDV